MQTETSQAEYLSFWDTVGEKFPSLKGAASTSYYFQCEQTLLKSYFPSLDGRSLFKSDLWDEAKNTEILRWAAEQGARPYGVDIAPDVVMQARYVLRKHQPRFSLGDVRGLPFVENSFDLIYSMGTIEHFPEFFEAVKEMYRVLKPGGTAIIGVPNKRDPFLRPLMVDLLNRFGLYAYGMEKSFSHGELRSLLSAAGFQPQASSGILFIPGWLRIADLVFHTRAPLLEPITAALVAPFVWLHEHVPAVRSHGYMIACVATKPS